MKPLEEIIKSCCGPMEPLPTETNPELYPLPGIKAVLFDVYGTLFISGSGDVGTATAIDTAEALTQSLVVSGFEGDMERAGQVGKELLRTEILEWHKAGHDSGVEYPEVEITKVWKRVTDNLRLSTTLSSPEAGPEQLRRLAIEYECRVNPVYPMPGSDLILRNLRESGRKLGIISNAQFYTPLLFSAFFDRAPENLGFENDYCIWSYKELKAKPSADLFSKILNKLQEECRIAPDETAYVGNDMLNDIYCASEAGCRTVLFAGDRRSLRWRKNDERCRDLKPDAIVTELNQLKDVLK